jgi:hypothetical protein
MKQNLENGFMIKFSFRFKRIQNSLGHSLNATQLTEHSSAVKESGGNNCSTSICYVFQNTNEISSWRKDAPINLNDLREYLCIKVGMIETTKRTDSKSTISLYYFDSRKLNTEECLKETILDSQRTNFA